MNIVRANYAEACALLANLRTKPVAFVSVDCEFTGIHGKELQITDTPDQRYEDMCKVVCKFRIMQMGFTVFVAEGPGAFLAYPFNVYLFPSAEQGEYGDIVMDMDTINFHKDHHFDFNKWAYEGLAFTSPDGANETTPKGCFKLHKMMSEETGDSDPGSEFMDQDITMKTDSDFDSEGTEGITIEHAERLFRALVEFKVPIIGHNPLIDLMFLYSEFCGPLPDSLPEFKSKILKIFPSLFDTMMLVSDSRIQALSYRPQSCNLEAMYHLLQYSSEASITLSFGSAAYSSSSCFHDAGYDSYITGYCFAKMLHYFPVYELEKYRNKVYSHKSVYAINLQGDEELPANIAVYVGKLVEGRKFEHMEATLNKHKESAYIQYVDNLLAFIAIQKKKDWENVVEKLLAQKEVVVMEEWTQYVKSKKQGKECTTKMEIGGIRHGKGKKRGKSQTGLSHPNKPPPGYYVYFGYPMHPMPRASLYWSIIQSQCYYAHLVNSEH